MKKIKENFSSDYYNELLSGRKNTTKGTIVVEREKESKSSTRIGKTNVDHCTIACPISLMVECSKVDRTKFGFKFTNKLFDEMPFFRFDSSGTTHRNKIDNVPLKEQMITPPHFHKYDDNGRAIAFKTEAIKDTLPIEASVDDCFAEFCKESNTRYVDEVYPVVETTPVEELKLDVTEIDPLKNITFAP